MLILNPRKPPIELHSQNMFVNIERFSSAIPCDELPSFDNTEHVPNSNITGYFRFGDVIYVNCSIGYAYNESLAGFSTSCNETGQWMQSNISCQGTIN